MARLYDRLPVRAQAAIAAFVVAALIFAFAVWTAYKVARGAG